MPRLVIRPLVAIVMLTGGQLAATVAVATGTIRTAAVRALRKPRGLSVSFEVSLTGSNEDMKETSKALRDLNAATLFTPDLSTLEVLVSEQESARGDFPGPCPVLFNGDASLARAALSAGASAVVVPATDFASESIAELGAERVLWRVANAKEARSLLETRDADAFIVELHADTLAVLDDLFR